METHRTPRQLGLATLHQFPNVAHGRVAERGVQYLPWVFSTMPTIFEGLGHFY